MMSKRRLLGLLGILCAFLGVVLFANNSFAASLSCSMTAKKKVNWPSVYESKWHVRTIKSSELKKAISVSVPGGYYAQGSTITEKHYVFNTARQSGGSGNYLIFVNRSTKKVEKKIHGSWGHGNSMSYDWGTKHIRIDSSKCIDDETYKSISIKNCKTKSPKNLGTKALITQGRSQTDKYILIAGWDAHCYKYGSLQSFSGGRHHAGVFIYDKSSEKLVKTLFIANKLVPNEIEDVAVDGNGDIYVIYNHDFTATNYYKIDKSIVQLDTDQGGGGGDGEDMGLQPVDNNDQSAVVPLAPEREFQCATILSFWCEEAESDGANAIMRIISFIVSILTVGVGVMGTIGFIIVGMTLMTARDDVNKVQNAKQRAIDIIIGLSMWVLIVAIIALMLPSSDAVIQDVTNGGTDSSEEAEKT